LPAPLDNSLFNGVNAMATQSESATPVSGNCRSDIPVAIIAVPKPLLHYL